MTDGPEMGDASDRYPIDPELPETYDSEPDYSLENEASDNDFAEETAAFDAEDAAAAEFYSDEPTLDLSTGQSNEGDRLSEEEQPTVGGYAEQDIGSVVEEIDMAEDQLHTAVQGLRVLAHQQGEDFEAQVYAAIATRRQERGYRLTDSELADIYAAHLDRVEDPAMRAEIEGVGANAIVLADKADMLGLAAHELSNRTLTRARDKVATTTDWQAVIDKYGKDGPYNTLRPSICIAGNSEGGQHLYYVVAQEDTRRLETLHAAIIEQGDTLPVGETWQQPEGWAPDLELGRRVNTWLDQTTAAYTYMPPNRQQFIIDRLPVGPLTDIGMISEYIGMHPDRGNAETVLPPLAHALETRAHNLIAELEAQDDAYRAAMIAERADVTTVHSPTLAETMLDVDNATTWMHTLLERHPSHMVAGISDVYFEMHMPDGDAGQMEYNGTMIVAVDHLQLRQYYLHRIAREGGSQAVSMQEAAHEESIRTVDHKIGHHQHQDVLSLPQLRAWDAVRTRGPQLNSDAGEDYALSVEKFMSSPWSLLGPSDKDFSERFNTLNEWYGGRYSPEAIARATEMARQQGRKQDIPAINRMLVESADGDRNLHRI